MRVTFERYAIHEPLYLGCGNATCHTLKGYHIIFSSIRVIGSIDPVRSRYKKRQDASISTLYQLYRQDLDHFFRKMLKTFKSPIADTVQAWQKALSD